ncbi:hypothetical protein PINS_up010131 [Pythium insidiosum]|nr:hypothetical protein PINS_up010131 [Pythium insidiosum]
MPAQPHVKPLALLPMADGSDELEIATIYDVLSAGGMHVVTAVVETHKMNVVQGAHGKRLRARKALEDCIFNRYDVIALPGGIGASKLAECDLLQRMLKLQKQEHRWIAANGTAAALVLGANDLIDGHATCDPSGIRFLGEHFIDQDVVVSEHVVTSQGPGTAMKLALKLISLVCGEDEAGYTGRKLLYPLP